VISEGRLCFKAAKRVAGGVAALTHGKTALRFIIRDRIYDEVRRALSTWPEKERKIPICLDRSASTESTLGFCLDWRIQAEALIEPGPWCSDSIGDV
jgi:hypothetical protein